MRRYLPLLFSAALVITGLALLSVPVAVITAGVGVAGGWYLFEEVDE